MKAGEYIGKDRKQYTVTHLTVLEKPFIRATSVKHDGDGVLYGISTIVHITQDHPDWPAATDALDALIEQDEEWVELPVPYFEDRRMRVRGDGSLVQHRRWNHDWQPLYPPDGDDHASVLAYRKGREVKEAEDAELREQVKALVEALFEVERGEEPPHTEWDDVLDMARRLGEVLSSVTASDTLNSRNDNVRALVEAVKNAHIWRNETRSDTGPLEWPTAESWYEIKAASKAVQL